MIMRSNVRVLGARILAIQAELSKIREDERRVGQKNFADHTALRARLAAAEAVVDVAACPDCGSLEPRQRNGGVCRYVFHELVAAFRAMQR
jgi:hypothetical protein